jgi:putative sterol carrier protein
MTTTAEIMESLPDRFRPKYAGKLMTTVQFVLKGEDGGRWYISVSDGLCSVQEGEVANPEATIIMDASDMVGINLGTVSAVDTFWSGRITIEGNIDIVLALPPVMNWS